MRRFLILLMLLLLFIPTAIGEAPSSPDPWFNPSWKYRVPITIDNTANANNLTDYQVLVTVDTASLISAGKMRSDGGDIRFTDSDGALLSYWIESGINTAKTKIWVKVPSIPAKSTKTIFMYYGSTASVSSASDGASTFIMFSKSLFPVWTFSLGSFHSCAIKSDGTVWCWGYNGEGELGDDTTTNRYTPVQVVNLTNVVSVAAGCSHTCALKSDGTVWCWGYNGEGELGDNTTTDRYTPVQVVNLTNVVSVAAGCSHTCALKSDGTVWCWGYNGYGQLGDNTTTDRYTPVQVVNLTNVVSVAAGDSHSCALKSDGTVWCWGFNSDGELGDNTTTDRYTPVQVSRLTNVLSVAAGGRHTCALKSDGTVWCWGYNGYGQLGDGTTTNRYTPVQVSGLTNVVSVAAGYYHTCALKSDGTVWCWGYNGYGQLGDNTTTDRYTPVQVVNLTNVVSVAAGNSHSCAIKSDGSAWCWGFNSDGELGDGTTTKRYTPVQVLNYNLGGRYDKTNTIYSVPKYTVDDFFVRSFADPEPTISVGKEQVLAPPTVKAYPASYVYQAGGKYNVSADACNVTTVYFKLKTNETYDSYTQINSSCNRYFKSYTDLPAGNYTITVYGTNSAGGSSSSATLVINKGVPSLSLAVQNGTWIQGASVTTSKNNVGDSDLIYKTFIGNTYLGGVGTFPITNLPSGIYDVVFNVTEGQNWTSASVSKKLEIYKAWEKTDSIYSNKSYRYDYDKSAVPVVAYFKYKSANSTAYVNKYLYVYSLTNVTNNDTILHQTFTNIIVNVSAPSGFILLNSSYSIPSLAYGEVHQANVYAKAVCVYEKAKSLNTGHATYTLTVNSSFVSELPVVYQLSAPPDWDKRTSYSMTVDGKTTGFTFDPNTLTLEISTSFSHSSLEPGDHIIDLQYSLPSPPPSGPTPSTGGVQPSNVSTAPSGAPSGSQVEVVNPPPQNVISTPAPVSGIFQIFGIPFPLKYVFIALMVIICVLLILVPRRKRRKATWLK